MAGIDDLFQQLHEAYQATQTVNQLVGRMFGLRWAIVSEVANTPEQIKLAMVKVNMPHQGANSSSDWLLRIVPWQGLSVPMPKVGDTVLVGYEDGNPSLPGYYVGLPNNLLNPAYQDNTVWRYDFNDHVYIELSKEAIKLSAFVCSITLTKELIDITAPKITFNGSTATAMTVTGGNLNFNVPGKVQAKGKNIAVIGAKDTRNDVIIEDEQG